MVVFKDLCNYFKSVLIFKNFLNMMNINDDVPHTKTKVLWVFYSFQKLKEELKPKYLNSAG